ncbi:putative germin-like protein 2-1 [Vitis vinifera]|uniref:Putative germin-like protein 2-1 n=1 Tax=Vitis vinifera TaxID=29760 RepID=A0A438H762_VITVI|nr:putative germin-like protein 2-1 [Vitis vinifera]
MATKILLLGFLALTCSLASASDSSPLQDFCVADPNGPVKVNGFACKNAMAVQASDFSFGGLHITGNTSNPVGSRVTPVTVAQVAGLNTLGISLARIDYAPKGINPPHTHPRASEILTVVDGSLERNVGKGSAIAIAALSSQNPGVITIANAVFGSKPDISTDIPGQGFPS